MAVSKATREKIKLASVQQNIERRLARIAQMRFVAGVTVLRFMRSKKAGKLKRITEDGFLICEGGQGQEFSPFKVWEVNV